MAGMIGSALFITVFTIEGWLRAGYNPRSTFISELSIGPRGWIQILNFLIQRMVIIPYLSWIFTFAFTLRSAKTA